MKVLVFPGVLFLLFYGGLLAWLDEEAARLLRGHRPACREKESPWRKPGGGGGSLSLHDEMGTDGTDEGRKRERETAWPQYASFVLTAALAALGVGGVLLVSVKGDLLLLALPFAAAEALPLLLLRGAEEDLVYARLPIAFRSAFSRVATFISLALVVSFRFPGDFDPSLVSFRGDTVFAALGQWEGFYRLAAATALGFSAVSAWILVLGDPAWAGSFQPRGESSGVGRLSFFARAAQRGFLLAVFLLVFLGYPGRENGGYVFWPLAVLGLTFLSVCLRGWLSGVDGVRRRKFQWWGVVPAALSLALMAVTAALW